MSIETKLSNGDLRNIHNICEDVREFIASYFIDRDYDSSSRAHIKDCVEDCIEQLEYVKKITVID